MTFAVSVLDHFDAVRIEPSQGSECPSKPNVARGWYARQTTLELVNTKMLNQSQILLFSGRRTCPVGNKHIRGCSLLSWIFPNSVDESNSSGSPRRSQRSNLAEPNRKEIISTLQYGKIEICRALAVAKGVAVAVDRRSAAEMRVEDSRPVWKEPLLGEVNQTLH